MSTKLSLNVSTPSLTVIVIVAIPLCPPFRKAFGVTVTVRFAPLPPKTMFASGTNAWLLDLPVNVSAAAGAPTSPTVKGIAPVLTPRFELRSPMSLIVGGMVSTET